MHDTRRTRVVLGLLLAAALALITIDYRGGITTPLRGLRSVGGAVFGSAENLASLVTRPVAAVADGVTGNSGSQARIGALQRQVLGLQAQLSQQRLSKYDDRQLKQLLQLAGRGRYRVVTANVIAAGGNYDDSVTVDAGRNDGIKPDMTVLNGQGLVGTIASVNATTSTVLLSTDASVTVGVRLAGPGRSAWSAAPASRCPATDCSGSRCSTSTRCSAPGSSWSRSGRWAAAHPMSPGSRSASSPGWRGRPRR